MLLKHPAIYMRAVARMGFRVLRGVVVVVVEAHAPPRSHVSASGAAAFLMADVPTCLCRVASMTWHDPSPTTSPTLFDVPRHA